MNKTTKTLTIILFISQIFIWVFSHSLLVDQSFSLAEKKVQIEKIADEEIRMEKTIAHQASLSAIEERSLSIKLIPVDHIVILSLNQQFALQNNN
jgi:hypothetical protein